MPNALASNVNLHAAAKVCQAMRYAFNQPRLNRRRRRYWMHVFEKWANKATGGKAVYSIRFYDRGF